MSSLKKTIALYIKCLFSSYTVYLNQFSSFFFSEISYMNICNPNNADSDCVEQGNIINHSQPLVVLENVPIKIRNSKGDQFLLLWTFSKEICLFFTFEMNSECILSLEY